MDNQNNNFGKRCEDQGPVLTQFSLKYWILGLITLIMGRILGKNSLKRPQIEVTAQVLKVILNIGRKNRVTKKWIAILSNTNGQFRLALDSYFDIMR